MKKKKVIEENGYKKIRNISNSKFARLWAYSPPPPSSPLPPSLKPLGTILQDAEAREAPTSHVVVPFLIRSMEYAYEQKDNNIIVIRYASRNLFITLLYVLRKFMSSSTCLQCLILMY